jgi:hypothetical protein
MIQIIPVITKHESCTCGSTLIFAGYIWQGLHIGRKEKCDECGRIIIESIPVNQSEIEQYRFLPLEMAITDTNGNVVKDNWFSKKLKSIVAPVREKVNVDIEIFEKSDDVIILNTLDYIYGHSLSYLFNLQRIIDSHSGKGIIVIVQPMMKWLLPKSGISEIWTVNLGFSKFNNFYPDLSDKINMQLERFSKVFLSNAHVIPTNSNIDIERFTGIRPYDFRLYAEKPRITYIWREDPDRLWIRNIYLLKGLKKLGFKKILVPFQYLRVVRLFRILRKNFGTGFSLTITGLGKSGKFPDYIDDQRITSFDIDSEKRLCQIYAASILVVGVHGSSMLLPSAHAGMALSLLPSKRWGNYIEDIMFTENDVRLASYQRRSIPLNISLFEIRDIIIDMISGRDYFIKKFIHSEEL